MEGDHERHTLAVRSANPMSFIKVGFMPSSHDQDDLSAIEHISVRMNRDERAGAARTINRQALDITMGNSVPQLESHGVR